VKEFFWRSNTHLVHIVNFVLWWTRKDIIKQNLPKWKISMLQINCIFGGDSMYSDVFAERIRTARQIKGETLQQVASGLNITNGTVSRYEMG